MNKITLTTFTDPMMGLSYECEPIFRKLETHFAGQIEFKYSMGLLVRNVYELCDCNELAQSPALGLHHYNARLAKIYENEESISGMPINMDGFCLFSTEETSSLPLNLAYKAAQLTAPELADRFLYNLRYATIVDTRPTTKLEEILKVVRQTGINEKQFLQHYQDSSAEAAMDSDLTRMHALGIHTLPAYLLQYDGKQMVIKRLIGYDTFVAAIRQISDGCIYPQPVMQSLQSVSQLLEQHPLISPIEVREALDFHSIDDVRQFIQPLIDSREITIRDVKRGWFIEKVKN
ncbi:MAG: DsbA family protein [Prevotella sp.]|nr:DsbA family protein [Prevotella sp.]